jgi:hypothetical protein
MADRSQDVSSAVALLANAGGMDIATVYANMAGYMGDLRTERRAAFDRKDYKMTEMLQADIAKGQEVVDALELAMLEA